MEERLKILQMLEEAKITAEEAATLLRALLGGGQRAGQTLGGKDGRYMRVRVSDLESGKERVNVSIPLGLVSVGLRMAERFAPQEMGNIDLQELEELITSGAVGKFVEVTDAEDGERVEVYIE